MFFFLTSHFKCLWKRIPCPKISKEKQSTVEQAPDEEYHTIRIHCSHSQHLRNLGTWYRSQCQT